MSEAATMPPTSAFHINITVQPNNAMCQCKTVPHVYVNIVHRNMLQARGRYDAANECGLVQH